MKAKPKKKKKRKGKAAALAGGVAKNKRRSSRVKESVLASPWQPPACARTLASERTRARAPGHAHGEREPGPACPFFLPTCRA